MTCAVMGAQCPSTAPHSQGENLSRLAFRDDLEGPAANLAVRGKLLRGHAGVDHQFEGLPAIGTLHGVGHLYVADCNLPGLISQRLLRRPFRTMPGQVRLE